MAGKVDNEGLDLAWGKGCPLDRRQVVPSGHPDEEDEEQVGGEDKWTCPEVCYDCLLDVLDLGLRALRKSSPPKDAEFCQITLRLLAGLVSALGIRIRDGHCRPEKGGEQLLPSIDGRKGN